MAAEMNDGDASIDRLTDDDMPWLQQLTQEEISSSWLEGANQHLQYGGVSANEWRLSERTDWCRTYFYEGLLHFSEPDSPVHMAYEKNLAQRRQLPPVPTFVGSMRALYAEDLNVARASTSNPDVWRYGGQTITAKVAGIKDLIGETDGRLVVARSARVLAYEDFGRRISNLLSVSRSLGWPKDNASELLKFNPLTICYSPNRLLLQSGYLQQFGSADFTPKQVGGLLLTSPDKHLIALRWGVSDYTRAYLNRATEGLTTKQMQEMSQRLLDDAVTLSMFDERTVRAHRRYHAGLKT